jgi:hypothetical protein
MTNNNRTETNAQTSTAARPLAVPQVCPDLFVTFYQACQPVSNDIDGNPAIPDDCRATLIFKLAATVACEMYGESLALPMASRFIALNKAVRRNMLEDIGGQLFGDSTHLVEADGNQIYVRGIVVYSAAVADLSYGDDGFTAAELSVAILAAPAGCPIADCRDRTDPDDDPGPL